MSMAVCKQLLNLKEKFTFFLNREMNSHSVYKVNAVKQKLESLEKKIKYRALILTRYLNKQYTLE